MSDKQTIVDAFTEISARYEQVVDGELHRFWGWSYDSFVENLVQSTPLEENDRVLDVASGTAVIPLKLFSHGKTGGQVVGLDITYAMLQKGQQKIEKQQAGQIISLVCANAMSMPLQSGYFDVVLCGLATHHLDVAILLSEMQPVAAAWGPADHRRRGWVICLARTAGQRDDSSRHIPLLPPQRRLCPRAR